MLPLIGAALYAGGAGMDMFQRNKVQQQQNQSNQNYNQAQALWQALEQQKQAQFQNQANGYRTKALDFVGADSSKRRQGEEATRLGGYINSGQNDASKYMLSGQDQSGQETRADLGRKLNNAVQASKERIGNMATMGSYTNSSGGLRTTNPLALQEAGGQIDLVNRQRRNSLTGYNALKNWQPMQYSYNTGLLPGLAMSIGGAMMGSGMGQAGAWLGSGTSMLGSGNFLPQKIGG